MRKLRIVGYAAAWLAAIAFALTVLMAQVITTPGAPTDTPNQTIVTTNYLYYNKLHYAGGWSSSTTYNSQDLVLYNGLLYGSLQTSNLNQNPASQSAWWVALALNADVSTSSVMVIGYGASDVQPGSAAGATLTNSVITGPGSWGMHSGVGGSTCNGNPFLCTNNPTDCAIYGLSSGCSKTFGLFGAAVSSVVFGNNSDVSSLCDLFTTPSAGQVVVGNQSHAGCQNSIVVGYQNNYSGADGMAFGANITGSAPDSILMGRAVIDQGFSGIALGNHSFLTANAQLVLGGAQVPTSGELTDVYIGPPATNFTIGNASTVSLHGCGGGLGPYETGSGANQPGCTLRILGGASTGNAIGGDLVLGVTRPGTSGSSQNGVTEGLRIEGQTAVVSIQQGVNVLWRCTSAGNLRAGTLTTVSADCGTSVDTGLRVN